MCSSDLPCHVPEHFAQAAAIGDYVTLQGIACQPHQECQALFFRPQGGRFFLESVCFGNGVHGQHYTALWYGLPVHRQRMGYVVVCKAKRSFARCLFRFPAMQASGMVAGFAEETQRRRGRYCRWWRGRRWLLPRKRRGKRRIHFWMMG